MEQPLHKGAEEFAKNVNQRFKGRLEVKIFPNSQLGSIAEQLEQLQKGSIQMMFVNSSYLENLEPSFAVFDAPFVFDNEEHVRQFARSDIVQEMAKRLVQSRGIRILDASAIFGPRHLSTKSRPIRKPEDLKGLKIRVHEAQTRVDTIKAWGAEPVVTPTAEMYMALQTGLADGQESPLSWQRDNMYWEVQKYVMLTGHFVQNENIVINESFFQSLPDDLKKILKEEAIKLADKVTQGYKEANAKALDDLKAHGMVIVEDVDKQAFRKATEAMWNKWQSKWGQGLHLKVINKQYKVLSPEEWQNF